MTLQLSELEQAYVNAAKRDDQSEAQRLEALVDAAHEQREAALKAPGALLNAALWYASEMQWPVFPCVPGEKRPATAHGFKDASTNLDQIRDWWTEHPNRNIGLPTGIHFDVIDVDGPEGLLAFGPFLDSDQFDILALALTPRGRHYLVPPAGERNKTNLLPQVDYRGEGGYIVAPPSLTPSGTYRWSIPPQTPQEAA